VVATVADEQRGKLVQCLADVELGDAARAPAAGRFRFFVDDHCWTVVAFDQPTGDRPDDARFEVWAAGDQGWQGPARREAEPGFCWVLCRFGE
jgi:hypothetical protein